MAAKTADNDGDIWYVNYPVTKKFKNYFVSGKCHRKKNYFNATNHIDEVFQPKIYYAIFYVPCSINRKG